MAGKVKNLLKNRKKLLPKLLSLLIARYRITSSLLFSAGLIAAILLPLVGPRKTYFSENALLPGGAANSFSSEDADYVTSSSADIAQLASASASEFACVRDVHAYLTAQLEGVRGGPRVYLQPFSLATPTGTSHLTSSALCPCHGRQQPASGHRPHAACRGGKDGSQGGMPRAASDDPGVDHSNACTGYDEPTAARLTAGACHGTNLVALLRAYKADGRESLALVTPWRCQHDAAASRVVVSQGDATGLALGLALMRHLARVEWLAKDVFWLVPDARWGSYPAAKAWVDEYHSPANRDSSLHHTRQSCHKRCVPHAACGNETAAGAQCTAAEPGSVGPAATVCTCAAASSSSPSPLHRFLRAGAIGAALSLELHIPPGGSISELQVDPVGAGGTLANLDLVNLMVYSAQREQVNVAIGRGWSHAGVGTPPGCRHKGPPATEGGEGSGGEEPRWWGWQGSLWAALAPRLDELGRRLGAKWPGSSSVRQLLSFMLQQASGTPSGAHAAFSSRGIDAISVHAVGSARVREERRFGRPHTPALHRLAHSLEGCLRSANNLLEKLHQSFFFYLMAGEEAYLPIGDYIIPFALLVACLPLHAAALATQQGRPVAASMVSKAAREAAVLASAAAPAVAQAVRALPLPLAEAVGPGAAHAEGERRATIEGKPTRHGGEEADDSAGMAYARICTQPAADHVALHVSQWLWPSLALLALCVWTSLVGMVLLPVALGWQPWHGMAGQSLCVDCESGGLCSAADVGEDVAAVDAMGTSAVPDTASCSSLLPPWFEGTSWLLAAATALASPAVLVLAALSWRALSPTGMSQTPTGATVVGSTSREKSSSQSSLPVPPWVALKVVLLSFTALALVSLALLNFSLAMATALVMVPMCMVAAPRDVTKRGGPAGNRNSNADRAPAAEQQGQQQELTGWQQPAGKSGDVQQRSEASSPPSPAVSSAEAHKSDARTGHVSGCGSKDTVDAMVASTYEEDGPGVAQAGADVELMWEPGAAEASATVEMGVARMGVAVTSRVQRLLALAVIYISSPIVIVPCMMWYLGGCVPTWEGSLQCLSTAVHQWLGWRPLWYAALVGFYFPCSMVCILVVHL